MLSENTDMELFEGSASFWLKSKDKTDTVIICLHGFGASPYEAKPIAEKCVERGMDAVGPRLPGHGIKDKKLAKKQMSQYGMIDWLGTTRATIARAREQYKRVFIYGQSMGGAIALLMASEGLVDACAVTGAGIRLPTGIGIFHVLGLINFNVPHFERNDYINETYLFRNSKSIRQLKIISKKAKKGLGKINCPVFVCHSHNDNLIHPKIVSWIEESVKGPLQVKWYDKSGHTMPLDIEKEAVSTDIAEFFRKLIN